MRTYGPRAYIAVCKLPAFQHTVVIAIVWVLLSLLHLSPVVASSLSEWRNNAQSAATPDQRAESLVKLTTAYWHTDEDSALYFSRKGLAMRNEKISAVILGKIYFVHGFTHTMHGNSDSVLFFLQKAEAVFRADKQEYLLHRTIEQIGNHYREVGRLQEAEEQLCKAEAFFRKEGKIVDLNNLLINKGSLYYDQNRFHKAIDMYQEAATYDSLLNDTSAIALTKMGLGLVNLGLGRLFKHIDKNASWHYFQLGINQLRSSEVMFAAIGHTTGICYCKMAEMAYLTDTQQYEAAETIFNDSEACVTSDDSRIVTTLLVYQAEVLIHLGQLNEARQLLETAFDMETDHLVIPHVMAMGKFLKARILHEEGKYAAAHLLADTVVEWFKNSKQFAFGYPIIVERTGWYVQAGDFKQAFRCNQTAQAMKDSLLALAARETYSELSIRFENRLLNAKMQLAENEIESARSSLKYRNILVFLFILLLVALSLLIIWMRKQSIARGELLELKASSLKKENALKQSQLEKMELERKLKEEEADHYRIESEMREQELVFKSLQQANLLMINQSIKERLGPYQFRMMKKRDQETFIEELNALVRESARDPLSEFETMFTQLHSGFYEKLIAINPEFTRSELQMCALLRMNLPSKEIANLLNLSLSRVDQIRHQIRKKLELDGNRSLTSFLILI